MMAATAPLAGIRRVAVTLFLSRWLRSRAPLALALFSAVLCWYDWLSREMAPGRGWWETPTFIAAWTGLLLGYDFFDRLRSEGALRLALLRPGAPLALAAGSLAGAALASAVGLSIPLAYLLLSGATPSATTVLAALPVLWIGAVGFAAHALLLSLLAPRDTAAVLGVVWIFFGVGPAERWIPQATPAYVRALVDIVWQSVPTSLRLGELIDVAGSVGHVAVIILQTVSAMALLAVLLGRKKLQARREST